MFTQMNIDQFRAKYGAKGKRRHKYKASKTEYDGTIYDSKGEAGMAATLDMLVRANLIKDFDKQFTIECIPYNCHGDPVPQCKVRHKVDFRVHENDGCFTLVEYKGMEMSDWRRRRTWLEKFWLPENLDHEYVVVKSSKQYRPRG